MGKEEIEKTLKAHKEGIKEYVRKKRDDAGVKRESYKTILPTKYRNYMARANAKSMEFDLTIDEFDYILEKDCNYCGSNISVCIDRVDSKKGYIKGNVQPLCSKCNMMKSASSEDDFLGHISRIYNFLNQL